MKNEHKLQETKFFVGASRLKFLFFVANSSLIMNILICKLNNTKTLQSVKQNLYENA
jgi:hypothetical protein